MNLDSVQAEEQIFAETAGGNFGLHVGVGGGKDAGIYAARGGGADALEFAGFEGAQKLGLEIHRARWQFRRGKECRHRRVRSGRRDRILHR